MDGKGHGNISMSLNGKIFNALLLGLINTFMVIPVSISFCSIIFRDQAFQNTLPSLVKLVLFSSSIHQLCFSLFSSLPFAVGQVQDAGLIFLSAIAGSIAHSCHEEEDIIPTTLFILGTCTALLGCMLILVSKLKLASMVQYLPMPVIGGYLAFIGFFCGEAGLSMMAGVQVTSILHWNLFLTSKSLILLTPGLLGGFMMFYLLSKYKSPFLFPLSLLLILCCFFLALVCTGTSLQEARDYGWISPLPDPLIAGTSSSSSFFIAWSHYDLSKVEWHLLLPQFPTLFGMFLVVAFSSSLDVAAIELELACPLDYNRELHTVGISNLISGLCGGYTGSYIFTQTTFTMRRGITSRLCGITIALLEITVAFLPFSIISYIPKIFFGSLLVFIATELMMEWLVFAQQKMMTSEYCICLLTFFAIQMIGIELGMCVGIMASMGAFVITYSSLSTVSAVTVKSSSVIRSYEDRLLLLAKRGKVVTVTLQGYLFFGSAVKLLEEIKSKLVVSSNSNNGSIGHGGLIEDAAGQDTVDGGEGGMQTPIVDSGDGGFYPDVFSERFGSAAVTAAAAANQQQQQQHEANRNSNSLLFPAMTSSSSSKNNKKKNKRNIINHEEEMPLMKASSTSASSPPVYLSTTPTSYNNNNKQPQHAANSTAAGGATLTYQSLSSRMSISPTIPINLQQQQLLLQQQQTHQIPSSSSSLLPPSSASLTTYGTPNPAASTNAPANAAITPSSATSLKLVYHPHSHHHNHHHHHPSQPSTSATSQQLYGTSPPNNNNNNSRYQQMKTVYELSPEEMMQRYYDQQQQTLQQAHAQQHQLQQGQQSQHQHGTAAASSYTTTAMMSSSHDSSNGNNHNQQQVHLQMMISPIAHRNKGQSGLAASSQQQQQHQQNNTKIPQRSPTNTNYAVANNNTINRSYSNEKKVQSTEEEEEENELLLLDNSKNTNSKNRKKVATSQSKKKNNRKITKDDDNNQEVDIELGTMQPATRRRSRGGGGGGNSWLVGEDAFSSAYNNPSHNHNNNNHNNNNNKRSISQDSTGSAGGCGIGGGRHRLRSGSELSRILFDQQQQEQSQSRKETTPERTATTTSAGTAATAATTAATATIPANPSSSSLLQTVWENQQQQRKEKLRLRSYSDLINTTSPIRPTAAAIATSSTSAKVHQQLTNGSYHGGGSQSATAAGSAAAAVGIGAGMIPLRRESSYTQHGFQNNKPVIFGVPALSLQSTIPPPEYLATSDSQHHHRGQGQEQQGLLQRQQQPDQDQQQQSAANNYIVTEYLVLDFTGVLGIDATAARACFLTLVQFMKSAGVTVVFAHVQERKIEDLLRAHHVIHEDSIVIPDIDDALEWCEDQVLLGCLTSSMNYHYQQRLLGLDGGNGSIASDSYHGGSGIGSGPLAAGIAGNGGNGSFAPLARHQTNTSINSTSSNQQLQQVTSIAPTASATATSQQQQLLDISISGRNPSDYSKAWKDRQLLHTAGSTSHAHHLSSLDHLPSLLVGTNSPGGSGSGKLQSHQQHPQQLMQQTMLPPPSLQPIVAAALSAKTLRAILEDYLGVAPGTTNTMDNSLNNGGGGRTSSSNTDLLRQLLTSRNLCQYFSREHYQAGITIFDVEDIADKVYFIEKGSVEILTMTYSSSSSSSSSMDEEQGQVIRVNKASNGGVFGEADFILGKNHSVRAYCVTDCTCWTLTRQSFASMEVDLPQLCMMIQYALLRSLALAATCSMYNLHPTTATSVF